MAKSENKTREVPGTITATELFPFEMPFRAAHAIGLLIILIFATVTAAAFLVHIPETVRCTFTLVPEGGSDPVQSPFSGILETVHVVEGDQIEADQLLFVIRSQEIHAWTTELEAEEELLRTLAVRQEMSARAFLIERETAQTEIAQRESEKRFQAKYLETYEDIATRMRKLGEQGLAPITELLNHEVGLAGAERDVALAEQAHQKALLALRKSEAERERQISEEKIEVDRLSLRIAALKKQLENCEGDMVFVRAPFAGTVLSIARKNPGDVVALGQELSQIARADASPQAHLSVAESGVPRLKTGQAVKLYFEAFPYQRHGTCDGTLSWVSPAPIRSETSNAFVAFATPNRYTMKVHGEDVPLRAGMHGEARIQVGRRTLVEFAFAPLRQLRENMRDTEGEAH